MLSPSPRPSLPLSSVHLSVDPTLRFSGFVKRVVPWRVLKLGGTTMADAGAVTALAGRVADLALGTRIAVVVSALSGVTDALERVVSDAHRGLPQQDRLATDELETLAHCHLDHARALLGSPPPRLVTWIGTELACLLGVLTALRRRRRSMDELLAQPRMAVSDEDLEVLALSAGERLSAGLFHAALRRVSQTVDAELVDPTRLLVACGPTTDATPDLEATRRRVAGALPSSKAAIWVMPGFFARDPRGRLRLLGRGGSDTSATLLGAALDAERVEIWTDVDGVYTEDPHRHPRARRFERLGFDRAEALAQRGARVLHARSIAPSREADVPILVRDSFHPERPGTWIGRFDDGEDLPGGGS